MCRVCRLKLRNTNERKQGTLYKMERYVVLMYWKTRCYLYENFPLVDLQIRHDPPQNPSRNSVDIDK